MAGCDFLDRMGTRPLYRLADRTYVIRRGTTDVVHKVVAVGSRHGAVQKAVDFIGAYAKEKPIRAYGTYEEVFADPVRPLSQKNGPFGTLRPNAAL